MCGGAPVFPAAPTRFVYKPQAASAHDDALPESAAAALLSQSRQLLVAEAARGLLPLPLPLPLPAAALAPQQQMARRRRDRQASMTSPNAAAAAQWRGAPVPPPPPVNMRFVPNTTTTPAAADAMADIAAGFSAPSTPSYRSRSRSSSSPSPSPSPRGPPLTPSSSLYSAATAAWSSNPPPPMTMPPMTMPPFPTSSPPPPPTSPAAPRVGRVEVRQVWAHNFGDEARLIESLLPTFPYAAVDTAFPAGTAAAHHPATAAHTLNPEERYGLLRSTVDALDPVQLGLTLFDFDTAAAATTAAATRHVVVWQFNFRDSDSDSDAAAALRACRDGVGVNDGVDAAEAFGPRLREWVARLGLGRGGLVASRGGYDVACLVKLMHGPGVFRMPASAAELEAVVAGTLLHRHRWRRSRRAAAAAGSLGRVFDVREMARRCPMSREELRRGMDGVAAELNVALDAGGGGGGEARRAGAGYGSLVTCYMFGKLREICFDDDGKLARVDGVLGDITAF